jgi:hypothetical protein
MVPNNSAQIQAGGDSGGTCFLSGRVTGVNSFCNGSSIDLDNDGVIRSNELTSITSCTQASPDAYRAWANNLLLTDINVEPFLFVPALAGVAPTAQVTSVSATIQNVSTGGLSTTFRGAIRSGFVEVKVPIEPDHTMCSHLHAVAPLSGPATVKGGVCLGDGLVHVML